MDFELSSDRETWIPAVVPGGVHESLLAAGLIDSPLQAGAASNRWVEDSTWWYRTQLHVEAASEDERLVLVLPCVDTVADFYLDGFHVAHSENAFVPVEIDITAAPEAELSVCIAPPLQGLEAPQEAQQTADLLRGTFSEQPSEASTDGDEHEDGIFADGVALSLRRKPTYSWGWDFAPRLPSIGILAEPLVQRQGRVALTGVHVRAVHVDVERQRACVAVTVEARSTSRDRDLNAEVALTGPDGHSTVVMVPLSPSVSTTAQYAGEALVDVERAHLWWTHDLGEPHLYEVRTTLVVGDAAVASDHCRVGLRTITLAREPDADGTGRGFTFLLNGLPTFTRGANWVPTSMMRGSTTPEYIRSLVALARLGNHTMLRVWGGGAYEQDAFYDACDENGLLVWQDFMFACTDYPSADPTLLQEVAREAEYQVRRLRNHASLALWCGNNEVHVLHELARHNLKPGNWGWHFFHVLLPDAVTRWSPGTPYWPGSPWGQDDPAGVNGVHDGDRHAWEVWHGLDIGVEGPQDFPSPGEELHWARYAHDRGRFISEFGIQASPQIASLAGLADVDLDTSTAVSSDTLRQLAGEKGWQLLSYETGTPTTLEQFADYSMACQAEGLKFGIEHYRRQQPHTSGTLVWQLNDAWPCVSWSIVDHSAIPKMGFYAVQRAYRPVIATFKCEGPDLELWLTNAGPDAGHVELSIDIQTFDGQVTLAEKVTAHAKAYKSLCVWRQPVERTADHFAWVSSPSHAIAANRLFFAPLKALPLHGSVSGAVTRTSAHSADVTLTAHGFAYAARLVTPTPDVELDSNYVDLCDGDTHTIALRNLPVEFDLATLTVRSYGTAARPVTVEAKKEIP